jgi:hypothetical protein
MALTAYTVHKLPKKQHTLLFTWLSLRGYAYRHSLALARAHHTLPHSPQLSRSLPRATLPRTPALDRALALLPALSPSTKRGSPSPLLLSLGTLRGLRFWLLLSLSRSHTRLSRTLAQGGGLRPGKRLFKTGRGVARINSRVSPLQRKFPARGRPTPLLGLCGLYRTFSYEKI